MASTRATLSRQARATAAATWATSRAWVRRVRWWSAGKMNTWVLPASRRNAVEWRIRSRSRSKQVRQGSGSSGSARRPAPAARVAPAARAASSAASRASRSSTSTGPTGQASPPAWAWRTAPSTRWPAMVAAHCSARLVAEILHRSNATAGRRRPATGLPEGCSTPRPVAPVGRRTAGRGTGRAGRAELSRLPDPIWRLPWLRSSSPEGEASRGRPNRCYPHPQGDRGRAGRRGQRRTPWPPRSSRPSPAAGVLWLTDRRGRRVGVPSDRVAYVELNTGSEDRRVGFGAAVR